ncbi:MAG: hypothetical protein ACREGH_03120 [Minisyncoccia bacterium]
MKKITVIGLFAAVIVLLVIVLGVLGYVANRMAGQTAPPPAQAVHRLLPDAYPLYSGAQWGDVREAHLENFDGYEATSTPIQNVTDIAVVSQPFQRYYADKLSASGWSVDNALAAGGPGSEIVGYQKGAAYLIVGYQSFFTVGGKNEPAQCPCNVSFFVFSGSSTSAQSAQ